MFRTRLLISLFIITLLSIGGVAKGDCVDDGNNDAGSARTVGFTETVSDVVCPDDPFDYFTFEIAGAMKANGWISLASEQTGTTLRITKGSDTLYERGTTVSETTVNYTTPAEGIGEGRYFLRVGYYSDYPYDHEYTLTLYLTLSGGSTVVVEPGVGTSGAFTHVVEGPATTTVFPGALVEIHNVPWPSMRGGASHNARSTYYGPPGAMTVFAEHDVYNDMAGEFDHYVGILAGNDDRLYCVGGHKIIAYDASGGKQWEHYRGLTWNTAFLDGNGNVYIITYDQTELVCLDPDGTELWSYACPEGQHYNDLVAVGARVYPIRQNGTSWYCDVIDTDGSLVYTTGPMAGGFDGAVEDRGAAVYFQTQYGLYQYDWSGTQRWYAVFPDSADWIDFGVMALMPLVGRDHKVWVQAPWHKMVYIYNPDGTLYHSYGYDASPGDEPIAVAYGANRKFYVAAKDRTVTCYSDWTTQEWQISPGGAFARDSLIMGQDDKLYIHYTSTLTLTAYRVAHNIMTINGEDGTTINTMRVSLPGTYNNKTRSELAIGEDKKLIYLNSAGYIVVYQPSLTFAPIEMHRPTKVLREP